MRNLNLKTKKFGRNEKCFCGSGKKYKKCCMNIYEKLTSYDHMNIFHKHLDDPKLEQELDNTIDHYTHNFKNEDFMNTTKVPFVRNYHNLPQEILKQIKLVLKFKPFNMGGCYYNSLYLSLLVDGVEKVDGFIYDDDTKDNSSDKYIVVKELGNGLQIVKNDLSENPEQLEFNENSGFGEDYEFLYDSNVKRRIIQHSWNKFGDIHFDLTLKLDWNGLHHHLGGSSKQWIEYFEFKSLRCSDETTKKLLLSLCDVNNIFQTSKCKVRNRFTISEDLWNTIGSEVSGSGYMCDGKFKNKLVETNQDLVRDYQNKYLQLEEIRI